MVRGRGPRSNIIQHVRPKRETSAVQATKRWSGRSTPAPNRPSVNLIRPLVLINVDILGVDHISLLFVRTRTAVGLAFMRPGPCRTRARTGRTCSSRACLLARLVKCFGDLVQ